MNRRPQPGLFGVAKGPVLDVAERALPARQVKATCSTDNSSTARRAPSAKSLDRNREEVYLQPSWPNEQQNLRRHYGENRENRPFWSLGPGASKAAPGA